jgi:hypothetical protein
MVTTKKPTKPIKPTRPTKPDAAGHEEEHGGDANITLTIRLGPMVSFQVEGRNCTEINAALRGFEQLNRTVDAMFSDLAKRVYPEGSHSGKAAGEGG